MSDNESAILAALARIEMKIDRLGVGAGSAPSAQARPAQGNARSGGTVASDDDLDDPRGHGDPEIKYDPREKYWTGASYVGCHYSQVQEPEYLDAMAKYLDAVAYMKRKDGDEKKAGYSERDAARARGWAARIRAGKGGAAPAPKATPVDDIPF